MTENENNGTAFLFKNLTFFPQILFMSQETFKNLSTEKILIPFMFVVFLDSVAQWGCDLSIALIFVLLLEGRFYLKV